MLTVNEGRQVAGKELGHVGHIFHFGQAAHRKAVQQLLAQARIRAFLSEDARVIDSKRDDRNNGYAAVSDLFGKDVHKVTRCGLLPPYTAMPGTGKEVVEEAM